MAILRWNGSPAREVADEAGGDVLQDLEDAVTAVAEEERDRAHRETGERGPEAGTREEMEKHQVEKEKLDAAIAASLQDAYAKEEQIKRFEEEIAQLKTLEKSQPAGVD